MSRRKHIGFNHSAIDAIGEDWSTVREFNSVLCRLQKRRLKKIERVGSLVSMLAWKVAVLQQALLYRVVELAIGCTKMWNAGNVLCSMLAARALLETIALALVLERRLQKQYEERDFQAMEELVNRHSFSSRDKEFIEEHRDLKLNAVSALTYIEKLEKIITKYPALDHYESMSEFCHPNSYGHNLAFGTLDTETGTMMFSSSKLYNKEQFRDIIIAYMLLEYIENWMNRVDELVVRISDAHPASTPFPSGRS
jgi:hypothetical protein